MPGGARRTENGNDEPDDANPKNGLRSLTDPRPPIPKGFLDADRHGHASWIQAEEDWGPLLEDDEKRWEYFRKGRGVMERDAGWLAGEMDVLEERLGCLQTDKDGKKFRIYKDLARFKEEIAKLGKRADGMMQFIRCMNEKMDRLAGKNGYDKAAFRLVYRLGSQAEGSGQGFRSPRGRCASLWAGRSLQAAWSSRQNRGSGDTWMQRSMSPPAFCRSRGYA